MLVGLDSSRVDMEKQAFRILELSKGLPTKRFQRLVRVVKLSKEPLIVSGLTKFQGNVERLRTLRASKENENRERCCCIYGFAKRAMCLSSQIGYFTYLEETATESLSLLM
jgi:hypothetical protein